MLRKISIEGFKCYHKKIELPLSQINILYGKNGRGKSSLVQILLLLSQTLRKENDLSVLYLNGNLISLGSFKDVLNLFSANNEFFWNIDTDSERVEIGFSEFISKTQLASLSKLVFNGDNRFSQKSNYTGSESSESFISSTSDIALFQNLKNLQYVSADRKGPSDFSQRDDSLDPAFMGVRGDYVINVLANKGPEFQSEVQKALSYVLSGATLNVQNSSLDIIELYLDSTDGSNSFRPKNVGFGYSYVLPVIVSALLAPENSILIIENPEAHLHPAAQSNLMKFLIKQAKRKNIQMFIESHSDHVVNGLRIAMKQNTEGISQNEGQVLFFSHDNDSLEPEVEVIKCDKNGELSSYPDDFLDEWTKQLLNLM